MSPVVFFAGIVAACLLGSLLGSALDLARHRRRRRRNPAHRIYGESGQTAYSQADARARVRSDGVRPLGRWWAKRDTAPRALHGGIRRRNRRRSARRRFYGVRARVAFLLLAIGYWLFGAGMPGPRFERFDFILPRPGTSEIVAKVGQDPIRVRDGDTIVLDGQPIRLQRANCPEIGETGSGPARDLVVRTLAAGSLVVCTPTGRRSYDRLVARCSVDSEDLGSILIDSGLCSR